MILVAFLQMLMALKAMSSPAQQAAFAARHRDWHNRRMTEFRNLVPFLLGLLFIYIPLPAPATSAYSGNEQALAATRSFALERTREYGDRATVSVGPLGSDSRLAACERIDVFLPPNHRLWGKTSLGVKCAAPKRWTIYVPVHVRVSGHYLISTRKLNTGQIVTASDLSLVSGELTTLPDSVLHDVRQAIGFRLKTGVGAKQALKREDLVQPLIIRQGERVKIRVRSANFSAESEGIALNDAAQDAPVKVRNANGKTLRGKARGAGEVEIVP